MVEKVQTSITKEAILSEIESWKNNPPEHLSWHSKLNNFWTYLPMDGYDEQGGRNAGYIVSLCSLMDVKNCKIITSDLGKKLKSSLFLKQTPREFFQNIDRIIENISEVSLKKIKKLQNRHFKAGKGIRLYKDMPINEEKMMNRKIEKSVKYLKQLYEYTLPIYVGLRLKGYSHYDLTG